LGKCKISAKQAGVFHTNPLFLTLIGKYQVVLNEKLYAGWHNEKRPPGQCREAVPYFERQDISGK